MNHTKETETERERTIFCLLVHSLANLQGRARLKSGSQVEQVGQKLTSMYQHGSWWFDSLHHNTAPKFSISKTSVWFFVKISHFMMNF